MRHYRSRHGLWRLLDWSDDRISHTGNTTETVLASVSVPGGAMGIRRVQRTRFLGSMTGSGGNRTYRVRLGGLAGTVFATSAQAATVLSVLAYSEICNINSVAVQRGNPVGIIGSGSTAAATAGTVDTSVAQDLVITGQLANAADVIALEHWRVELLSLG